MLHPSRNLLYPSLLHVFCNSWFGITSSCQVVDSVPQSVRILCIFTGANFLARWFSTTSVETLVVLLWPTVTPSAWSVRMKRWKVAEQLGRKDEKRFLCWYRTERTSRYRESAWEKSVESVARIGKRVRKESVQSFSGSKRDRGAGSVPEVIAENRCADLGSHQWSSFIPLVAEADRELFADRWEWSYSHSCEWKDYRELY